MSDTFDDLQTSYGRCLQHGKFIARFYEIFMGSHPDVPAHFKDTDFSKQYIALRRGITAAIAHAGGSTLTKRTMEQMACAHSRSGHAPVPPGLYPYWTEALLVALREHDPEYNLVLEQRWRAALEYTMKHFVQRY